MAQNIVIVNFEPCEPTPTNGYRVTYRPQGSSEELRTWPANFFSSPVLMQVNEDPAGTDYEGYIQGDCGDGELGLLVPWVAPNEGAPSDGES